MNRIHAPASDGSARMIRRTWNPDGSVTIVVPINNRRPMAVAVFSQRVGF